MKIKPITNDKDYQTYLNWVDKMFDKKVKPNSEEGQKVQVILMIIKNYEDRHFAIPVPDPIDAIKLKMQEKNLKNKDLEGIVGSKGYVSALLNKKKSLTLQLARTFHKELGIPADILLA
jgi:HTH-type transcriptional regulator/antitoxin HigA